MSVREHLSPPRTPRRSGGADGVTSRFSTRSIDRGNRSSNSQRVPFPAYNRVETIARPGVAFLTLTLKDDTPSDEVQEQFYQARKKLGDEARNLPSGAFGPFVNDEFSDVTAGGTVLILLFLPALYATWFRVKTPEATQTSTPSYPGTPLAHGMAPGSVAAE